MPNGGDDGYDPRELWEKVKDLQDELVKRADRITDLVLRVDELEQEKEALMITLKLSQADEKEEGD